MLRPLGPHIPVGPNLFSALQEGVRNGYTAVQVFGGPPISWTPSRVSVDDTIAIRDFIARHQLSVFVHAPYTLHAFAKPINAEKNNRVLTTHIKQAASWGANGYVVHMGPTKLYTFEELCSKLYTLCSDIGIATLDSCPLLLENSASGDDNSSLLSNINEIANSARSHGFNIGMCVDTLHAFAYGDGSLFSATPITDAPWMDNLKLIHLNSGPDSVKFGGRLDRHAALSNGVISPDFFSWMLKMHPETPVILERSDYSTIPSDMAIVRTTDAARDVRLVGNGF
jgi:endonuclease IV